MVDSSDDGSTSTSDVPAPAESPPNPSQSASPPATLPDAPAEGAPGADAADVTGSGSQEALPAADGAGSGDSAATATTAPLAAPQEAPSLRERLWPQSLAERRVIVALALAVVAYIIGVQVQRYAGMFNEFAADGDQPQAVFQYWRYHIAGAFKPGDLVTDYAFVMHAPPLWWAMMSTLSTLMQPLLAAKVLNLVAFGLTCVAMWFCVARRSHAIVGLAAVVLLIRNWDFSYIIAGGYARSFGPLLTILFLTAFTAGRHRIALGLLVLQAALYPSVVIPCGIAYGTYTVVAGPMGPRLRRMAGMFAAGLLIIAFGKFQDLASPSWWGTVVTLEQAKTMPAWGPGGRVSEVPLRPFVGDLERHFNRAFHPNGHVPSRKAAEGVLGHPELLAGAAAITIAVSGAVTWRRRRQGRTVGDAFPWQIPALFLAAFCSYVLARQLAFKLYVPYRPLQHVWPYMIYAGLPLLMWSLASTLIRARAAAIAVTFVVSVVPMMLLFGDGLEHGPRTYAAHTANRPLYLWIRSQPIDAVFAGEIAYIDNVPLFGHHRAYMTKNMAHPFRIGYYNEAERRLREMYTALYATDLQDVVAFGAREHVDFLIVREASFANFDQRLFQPLRKQLSPVFTAGRKKGFALRNLPPSAVVYRTGDVSVVDLQKLDVALKAGAPRTSPPLPAKPGIVRPKIDRAKLLQPMAPNRAEVIDGDDDVETSPPDDIATESRERD